MKPKPYQAVTGEPMKNFLQRSDMFTFAFQKDHKSSSGKVDFSSDCTGNRIKRRLWQLIRKK